MNNLNDIFGIRNKPLLTFVERQSVELLFQRSLNEDKIMIIYGSSKQGKTTLYRKYIHEEDRIVIQCSPNLSLIELYSEIISKLDLDILESYTEKDEKIKTKKIIGSLLIQIPTILSGKVQREKSYEKSNNISTTFTKIKLNLRNIQSVGEIIKKIAPNKYIIFENFHYMKDNDQQNFAFDLRTLQDLDVNVIIVGIWKERNRLTQYNSDLQDRLIEIPVEPWEKKDLIKIIEKGQAYLNIDLSNITEIILSESFGNVGFLQELCKECCLTKNILKTEEEKVVLRQADFKIAIQKKIDHFSNGIERSLETLSESRPRTNITGFKGLGLPHFFVKSLFVFSSKNYEMGITRRDILTEIKKIHPDHTNRQLPGVLTNFLRRIVEYQLNSKIKPILFDYDANLKKLNILDPNLIFYIKHGNPSQFLENLPIPEGYKKSNGMA